MVMITLIVTELIQHLQQPCTALQPYYTCCSMMLCHNIVLDLYANSERKSKRRTGLAKDSQTLTLQLLVLREDSIHKAEPLLCL